MPTVSDTHVAHATSRMQRDLVAAFDGKGIGLFASLGGSNSLGACDTTGRVRCNQTGFAELTYTALSELGVVRGCPQKQNGLTCGWANGGIGAMGPQLASACTSKFVPVGTRFATIEYLPNLGYTNDDAGELAALEKLLHVLQQRGARVAFVNILPGGAMERFKTCKDGKIGCTTRAHIERLHGMISALAANYSVPTVTMDHDGPSGAGRFGDDLMHLNQIGHAHVRDRLLHLYASWPHWQRGLEYSAHDEDAARAASRLPVACHMGEELEPLVAHARGFSRVNFARDPGARADKVGWEAREANSSLTLCARFPAEPAALRVGIRERPLLSNGGNKDYRYVLAVGMQISHHLNKPLYGVAHFQCGGACSCMCKWSHHGHFNVPTRPTIGRPPLLACATALCGVPLTHILADRVSSLLTQESCYFDGLTQGGATVTAFVRMLAMQASPPPLAQGACPRDACEVTITNSPDPDEPRRRVLVRALMMGYNEHSSSKWLNTYHLDGVGLTTYRRTRRHRRRR